MQRISRLLLVLVLIGLVIAGLNTSNQGIGRLTTEDRGQVLGVEVNSNELDLQVLSKDYVYKADLINKEDIIVGLKDLGGQAKDYSLRIWRIFKAIV